MLKQILILIGIGLALSLPQHEDIEKVAEYIDMLQATGKYHMIYSLFGTTKYTTEEEIKQKQAILLKKCYAMKKKGGSPLGEHIPYADARLLIVNGYKILTDKRLKEAYEWILNDSPPDFMEAFRRRKSAKRKIQFTMPSGVLMGLLVLSMLLLCDVLSTFSTVQGGTLGKGKKKQRKEKKEKKEKKRVTLRDTFTYRIFSKASSLFIRTNK
ncbi:hypothetical protein NEFER03_0092 [Nematocida sp. LUAm3]|nr:hypothetical protein NEFER03_0092 [Nematocida sp. LUAm3]KAI5173545.1 hypothetical protein NEFER02_0061 [Nematocida sp. LUAm2]KAI5176766.1 hypothetical protein NEFER01_0091 [Nematocida sp. LUAm1]